MSKNKNTIFRILFLIIILSANTFNSLGQKTVLFDENHGQLFLTGKTGDLTSRSLLAFLRKKIG